MTVRLDMLIFERGLAKSRTKAKELIENGAVTVNGACVTRPSFPAEYGCDIQLINTEEFVSRAGIKLNAAIETFGIDTYNCIALDIGASTGGFTDCLLRRGAKRVYAVDVGENQLDFSLRNDSRVVCMEKTNARYIKKADFNNNIDIAVMDLSFISQTLVYPAVREVLDSGKTLISLIKPQFEVGKGNIGKNGIVRNEKLYDSVFDKINKAAYANMMIVKDIILSPITGGDGNREFLAYIVTV